MTEHETNSKLLARYAAGGLDEEETRRVEDHLRHCTVCQAELALWGYYIAAARQQPQPVPPADLLARTQARLLFEREKRDQRRNDFMLLAIGVAISWAVTWASWYTVRIFAGGKLIVMGDDILQARVWFLISMLLAWMTAGTAAIALSKHRELRRSL